MTELKLELLTELETELQFDLKPNSWFKQRPSSAGQSKYLYMDQVIACHETISNKTFVTQLPVEIAILFFQLKRYFSL